MPLEKYPWKYIDNSSEIIVPRIVWDTPETVPPGSHHGPDLRYTYLIECNVSGYGKVTINGKKFDIVPRCCYFCLPGDIVKLEADEVNPRQAIWCIFGGKIADEILKRAGITSETPFVPGDKFDAIFALLEKMHEYKENNDLGGELIKKGLVYQILGELTLGRETIEYNHIVEEAVAIMETEYSSDLTISSIADKLKVDRSYLSNLFKKHKRVSPYSYLNLIRMKRACMLLATTNNSTTSIAEAVGIDPHNFSRIFQREMGDTPSEYRKKVQEEA